MYELSVQLFSPLIKEIVFGNIGETFESIEQNIKTHSSFFKKTFHKVFHTVTWTLDEDIKFNSVKCECCGEINWITDFIPTFSNIESNGWYIKKYGKIKCHESSRKTKSYECSSEDAKYFGICSIAEDVVSEVQDE